MQDYAGPHALSRVSHPMRIGLVAIILTILGTACLIVQPLLVGIYIDKLGFKTSTAGYISAAELAGLAITAIAVARSVRIISLRKSAILACLFFILANAASIAAGNPVAMAVVRFAAGCAAGGALAAGSAMAARTSQPDRVFALAFAGVTAYATLFFMIVPMLMAAHGYSAIFIVNIILSGVAVLTPLFSPEIAAAPTEAARKSNAVRTRRHKREALCLLACGFFLYVGHAAIWTYEERMGVVIALTPSEIGSALSLASISGMIGALIAAGLGTRIGRIWPQIIALLLSILAAALIVHSSSALSYTLSASLIAVSWFYGVPYLAGVASAIDRSGKVAGELQAVMNIGYALGPLAAATVAGDNYHPIGWLAAACYSLCLLLILALGSWQNPLPAEN